MKHKASPFFKYIIFIPRAHHKGFKTQNCKFCRVTILKCQMTIDTLLH